MASEFTSTEESPLAIFCWEGVTVFWDHKGVILEHHLEQRQTSNSERYSDMLQNQLKSAVRRKHCGLLSSGVCLQHDNARLRTAHHTME
jgi:hypothetical protein